MKSGGTTIEKLTEAYGEREAERALTELARDDWAVLPDQSVLARTGSRYWGLPLRVVHNLAKADA